MLYSVTLSEAAAFNPPGWVAWLAIIIAFALAAGLYLWMKQQSL